MFDLYRWLLGAPESPSSPTPSSPTQQQSPADVQGLSSLHASRSSRASDLGESQQGLDPDLLQKLAVIVKRKELLRQLGGDPKTE
ncbi:MAG: hypothetical protein WDW36_006567 [Sanguina aurantia]